MKRRGMEKENRRRKQAKQLCKQKKPKPRGKRAGREGVSSLCFGEHIPLLQGPEQRDLAG